MASYSVHQQPALFQPAYNDLMFVVSSTNNTQPNFNYIADLFINADSFRLRAPADPTYGSGVFNISRIIESYVSSNISKTTYGFQTNNQSAIRYHIHFGEEYGASSGVTQYANITSTVRQFAWNACLDFLDFQNYSQSTYLADNGKTLNRNIDRRIELTQQSWFYFIANDTTSYGNAFINAYNSAGTLIRSATITNSFTSSGTVANHVVRCSAGPANLNLVSSGSITDIVGSGDLVPSTTDYYTFQLSGVTTSPVYRHDITSPCKYPTYRLHFLNELGAFESFNFTKVGRKDIDVTRNKYKSPFGALTSASAFGYNKYDRQEKTYYTSMKEALKLKSDWLTEDEHDWLQELITSPEIYLDDDTHGLVAVTCTVNKIDVKTSLQDKLFNLEIDLDYSFNRYRQRL